MNAQVEGGNLWKPWPLWSCTASPSRSTTAWARWASSARTSASSSSTGDTSGPYDRGVKLVLYAQSGIPEYWIVDVGRGVIEVYRSPSGDGYASVEERGPGDRVSPEALPDVELEVSGVLGTS